MAPRQVVVDGSNIATEGRSTPSLAQLDQAVREFLVEYPDAIVTVVVDASFAHRIAASELSMYEEAEAAGEVVSPPAGAIGRGDAFLLRIADKTGAMVLSNDSFQEFHGEHEWLFDKGRLIGGKPVPGVGWIFTPRTPVRGPKSREAVKEAKRKKKGDDDPRVEMPGLDLAAVRARSMGKEKKSVDRAIAVATEEAVAPNESKRRRRRKGNSPPAEAVNDPLTFITFIAAHPLGSEVEATVESFASHGAFVEVEGARCYIPLSAMGSPAPKSAREVFSKGDDVRFVIQALDPQRRGVELALPGFANVAGAPTDETVEAEIAGESASADAEIEEPSYPSVAQPLSPPARSSSTSASVSSSSSEEETEAPSTRPGTRSSRRPAVKKADGRRPSTPAPRVGDSPPDGPPPSRRTRATKAEPTAPAAGKPTTPDEDRDASAQRASSRAAAEEVLAGRRDARRARLAEEALAATAEPPAPLAAGSEPASEPAAPAPAPRRSRRSAPAAPIDEPAAAVAPAASFAPAAAPAKKAASRRPPAPKTPAAAPAGPLPDAGPGLDTAVAPAKKTAGRRAPSTVTAAGEAVEPKVPSKRTRAATGPASPTPATSPAPTKRAAPPADKAAATRSSAGRGPAGGGRPTGAKAPAVKAPAAKKSSPVAKKAPAVAKTPVTATKGPGAPAKTPAVRAPVTKKAPAAKKVAATKKTPAPRATAAKAPAATKAPVARKVPAAKKVPATKAAAATGKAVVGSPGAAKRATAAKK